MPRKTPVLQLLTFLFVAVLIVLISVASTLYLSDIPIGDFTQRVGRALGLRYSHTTMTDAQLLCTDKLDTTFPGRVRSMHVDSLSSRLDKQADMYKIFLEADIYADSDRQGPAREMFFSCYVRTDREAIERFQYAGDSADGTGYFGL